MGWRTGWDDESERECAGRDDPHCLGLLALAGVALYGIAALRYAELYRRRRRPLPLAVLVAFILSAEAMIAVAFARTWHAMWWEWHVLMAVAFGAILITARMEYRREGSLTAVFAGIYLDRTLRRIDRHEAERLSAVVDAIRSGGPVDPILARLRQEGMSREEADVLEEGGLIDRFAGDAIIVVFNAVTEQPDHAIRAARAALAIRSEADRLAADHSDWPRFRIAVNTGPAMVGNVGHDLQRSFTVIGDTINLAARLQATAPPGEVVIGPTTCEDLGDQATVVPLGPAELRGKREPVPVYRLVSVTG
jgi:adenylate cyclase